MQAVTEEVLAAEAEADEDFARVLASQEAFRENYQYWKTLAYLPRDFDGVPTEQE